MPTHVYIKNKKILSSAFGAVPKLRNAMGEGVKSQKFGLRNLGTAVLDICYDFFVFVFTRDERA